jgi:hypothetical protein
LSKNEPVERVRGTGSLVAEHGVEVDHQMSAWLIYHCITIHVPSRVSRGGWRQASLHRVRERLNPFVPSTRKLSGPIIFFYQSGRQPALVVILSNYPQMAFAKALIAVAAMTVPIPIVVISPMLPPVVVVVIPSFDRLRRQHHPSAYREKY